MMDNSIHVVSLGDSIATGTLTPFSSTYSFVFYLRNRLREMGYRPEARNLAHDGDATRELLWKLDHSDAFCRAVESADVLTVSIGGNDLLKASSIPGFNSINVPVAEQGVRRFIERWPRIVDRIRSLNPRAAVVVLNLYNPYNESRFLGRGQYRDRNLCELTDRFLAPMNRAIADYAEGRYLVADVYALFKQYSQGRMHRVSCLYTDSMLRNPHPTPRAHRLIADVVCESIPFVPVLKERRDADILRFTG